MDCAEIASNKGWKVDDKIAIGTHGYIISKISNIGGFVTGRKVSEHGILVHSTSEYALDLQMPGWTLCSEI